MTCDEKTWNEFNELIRTQKHWMLNQFQIVMGYIQIGKTDMAFEFIKRSTSEVEGTSVFTMLPNKELGVRACLLWWKMLEKNFSLFPIIDKKINLRHPEKVFKELETFMDDLALKYYTYLTDKHITWKMQQQNNKFITILKIDEENDTLPNLYAENNEFLGKVNVEEYTITFIIED